MRPRMIDAAVAPGLFAAALLLAQERRVGGIGITVFQDPGFQGPNATFRDDVPDLSDYRLNDRVSSFRIGRGEFWEVCEHKDFGGRCAVFSSDEPDLGRVSWNDQISSLRRVRREGRDPEERIPDRNLRGRGRSELILYEDENYRGRSRRLDRADAFLSDFANRASSLRSTGGAWEVCDEPNFGGRCASVTGTVPDLRAYSLHDRIESARPIRGRSWEREPGPEPPADDVPTLVLYERPNFRGRSVELHGTEGELDEFNDRAQSARVVAGNWQICEHAEFRGRCVTLTESVPDLDDYRLSDAVTSARPVSYRPRR